MHTILTTLMASGALMLAAAQPAFDRAAAAQKIEARLAAYDDHSAKGYALWKRSLKGEDVKAQSEALGERPQLEDLKDLAVQVVDADPADAAAGKAIRVVLMTHPIPYDQKTKSLVWDSPQAQLNKRMADLLLQHHRDRPAMLAAVENISFTGEAESVKFWERLYESSSNPEVRGNAAAHLMDYYFQPLNDPKLPESERRENREKGMVYAKAIRAQFADVNAGPGLRIPRYMDRSAPLSEFVDNREKILAHSIGVKLPSIEVATVTGGMDQLDNYRGKVLIVDFWATWCGPCIAGHPDLVALKKELAGQPFEIIGISVDNKPQDVVRYRKDKLDLPWVQWHIGPTGTLLKEWGVQGFPTYLVVDAGGEVRERTNHLGDDSKSLIRTLVAQTKK